MCVYIYIVSTYLWRRLLGGPRKKIIRKKIWKTINIIMEKKYGTSNYGKVHRKKLWRRLVGGPRPRGPATAEPPVMIMIMIIATIITMIIIIIIRRIVIMIIIIVIRITRIIRIIRNNKNNDNDNDDNYKKKNNDI